MAYVLFLFFFLTSLLEYNCFTMVCQFLLYNKVNQLYIYIYRHIPSLLRLPPTLPIPTLQVVTKHRVDFPVLCYVLFLLDRAGLYLPETFDCLLSIKWNLLGSIQSGAAAPVIPLEGGETEVTPPGKLEGRVHSEFFLEILSQWESGRPFS